MNPPTQSTMTMTPKPRRVVRLRASANRGFGLGYLLDDRDPSSPRVGVCWTVVPANLRGGHPTRPRIEDDIPVAHLERVPAAILDEVDALDRHTRERASRILTKARRRKPSERLPLREVRRRLAGIGQLCALATDIAAEMTLDLRDEGNVAALNDPLSVLRMLQLETFGVLIERGTVEEILSLPHLLFGGDDEEVLQ